ncbi:PRC-barrel domain-containing protein [Aurantimonas litoralis]|nr:PRC-barrel domain-containing protein [Aurantimonas litoralis]
MTTLIGINPVDRRIWWIGTIVGLVTLGGVNGYVWYIEKSAPPALPQAEPSDQTPPQPVQQAPEAEPEISEPVSDQLIASRPRSQPDSKDDTTATIAGAPDQQQMTPVTDSAQLTADNLMGTTVYGADDSSVGDIGDIALNAEGSVDAVIVDVGGFMGIGAKQVAVAMDNLQFMQDANGSMYLYTQFTQEQLENAPEYNADTYADNREIMRLQKGQEPSQTSPGQGTAGAPVAN